MGKLGHCDEQNQLLPKEIVAFAGRHVVTVSAGYSTSLAVTADGGVWSWGYGGAGRLGHGDQQRQLLPKKIEALAGQRVVAVLAGDEHSLALTADGVWSCGRGHYLMLGHDNQRSLLLPNKIEALAGQRVVAVSAGQDHSLALFADGAVCSWGGGGCGQLGHSDEQRQLLPKKIEALADQRVIAVSTGPFHSIALTADSAVFTWGKGEQGCLGHGEDESWQLLPKKIEVWAPGQ